MDILQGIGDLQDVGQDRFQRLLVPCREVLLQSAIRGVSHNQEGHPLFDAKIQHRHNMRMSHTSQIAGLNVKVPGLITGWPAMQHFESGFRVEVDMLPQIDTGETTLSQLADNAIVAKLLVATG